MSFGAGALLSALTLELVHESLGKAGFPPLGVGCVVGALLFMGRFSLLLSWGFQIMRFFGFDAYQEALFEFL